MTATEIAKQLRQVVAAGPHPGEDFFRMKVTASDGGTQWMNVSAEDVTKMADALEA
jgi:hypothetical protein